MKFPFYTLTFVPLIHASAIAQDRQDMPIDTLEPFVITSSPLAPEVTDLTQAWTALDGDTLEPLKAQTIGETLADQPGIAQTFYGPAASRPIIRGLEGQRVRVLQNGLNIFDVSAASVDHAVAVDPLLIERIEILRGSAALLYGTNAIGGVVNIIDRSIPYYFPDDSLDGQSRLAYKTVNDGWDSGTVIFTGAGNVVVQAYGIWHETSNYQTPKFTLEGGTRVSEVANSQSKTWQTGTGASYLLDNGYVGMAFSQFDTQYGVPSEEASTIELESKRFEAKGVFEPQGPDWLNSLNFSLVYGDYRHDELEATGEVGTTFLLEGIEARVEALHTFGSFEGVFGFQGNFDTTKIRGEESLISGDQTGRVITEDGSTRLAAFVMEEYTINDQLSWNAGGRMELWVREYKGNVSDDDDAALNASTGLNYKLNKAWSISGNFTFTERIATSVERYADGTHHATETYEIGDPSLDEETSLGIDATIGRTAGPITGRLTGYYTWFAGYIYLADTDLTVDVDGEELERRDYQGVDAEFYGVEAEAIWRAFEEGDLAVDLKAFGDYVRTRNITDGENLPRTPPWRLVGGVEVNYRSAQLGLDVIHTGKQTDTAPGEEVTNGYTLMNLFCSYTIRTDPADIRLYAKGTNLTNELARVHTSFLRDSAPLPGASLEVGVSVGF